MTTETITKLHESNRAAWNEGAIRYAEEVESDIHFLRDGGANFCPPEFPYLQDLEQWCGRAIHLQCAGGRDTLSLWNVGAKEVVGIDISDTMIECAQRKSEALQAPATWYRSDVLQTPIELDGTADLVYTGRGALIWIMYIDAWATVPARLLKPGGALYIFDGHPLTWVWDADADHYKLDARYGNYFSTTVEPEQGWSPNYIGDIGVPTEQQVVKYERQWNLGQIVSAVAAAGLRIERLEEHGETYWDQFPQMLPELVGRLPNTFSLLARKPEA
ncbi:MAG: class I SAM-dependent methyltransferase [Armatimonadota bacterium]